MVGGRKAERIERKEEAVVWPTTKKVKQGGEESRSDEIVDGKVEEEEKWAAQRSGMDSCSSSLVVARSDAEIEDRDDVGREEGELSVVA